MSRLTENLQKVYKLMMTGDAGIPYDGRAKGAWGEARGSERTNRLPRRPTLEGFSSMRYLVVLEALGRGWEAIMRGRGVRESTIESWAVYYNQLTMQAATCKAEDLRRVGQQVAQSFRTALYYIEKGEES